MSEVPKSVLYASFIDAAAKTVVNGDPAEARAYLEAQSFFIQEIMGVDPKSYLNNPFSRVADEDRAVLSARFMAKAADVTRYATGTEIQSTQTLGYILEGARSHSNGLYNVLNRMALKFGAREPSFGAN